MASKQTNEALRTLRYWARQYTNAHRRLEEAQRHLDEANRRLQVALQEELEDRQ